MKSATIQARVEPKLKKDVEVILGKLGLSPSEAITLYYTNIKLTKGIPFEVRLPNKRLKKAMKDVDARRGLSVA